MDVVEPPEDYDGEANFYRLEAGTVLYRVHRATRPATEFNTQPVHSPFRGGRFDATPEDEYGFLYAGTSQTTALAERLLRDVPFDSKGERLLPRSMVAERALSRVDVTADLALLALVKTPDLAAVAQTPALVQSGDYARTRYCGHWLRRRFRRAQGFIWQSNRDMPHLTLVLFDDRGDAADALASSPDGSFPLDTPEGIDEVNRVLAPYNVAMEPA